MRREDGATWVVASNRLGQQTHMFLADDPRWALVYWSEAANRVGAPTFLHESNTIPGRANRWLARVVHRAFVGFPTAAGRLHNPNVTITGTPVRLV